MPESFGTCPLSSPTKRYRGSWEQTAHNSASWHKYEEAPYPLDRHETSLGETTCTPQYLKASSMPWPKLPDALKTDMRSRKDSSRRPLTTFSGPASHHSGSTPNDLSKMPHRDTKRI